jgi:cyanophycinase-like exopeptidase
MPQANVIRWRDGAGWLVLSGGADSADGAAGDIEANALARVKAGRPVAYVWAAGDVEAADKHLEALEDLGAPTGYLVDVLTEDDDTLRQQLEIAGLVILGDGPNVKELRSGLLGAAIEGIASAYETGAVILGIGPGAAVLGGIVGEQNGLNWVEGAIVVPTYEHETEQSRLRDLLKTHPEAYGLGIATGSALALGPAGEVEAWGDAKVTVTLGQKVR